MGEIASTGQTCMQTVHPVQSSRSIEDLALLLTS
jgi:hypothetical protein